MAESYDNMMASSSNDPWDRPGDSVPAATDPRWGDTLPVSNTPPTAAAPVRPGTLPKGKASKIKRH